MKPGIREDQIAFEILEDGTISMATDQVSGVNHLSADSLIRETKKKAGGVATKKSRPRDKVGHSHVVETVKQGL